MSARVRYPAATAFRMALEQRLRSEARSTGVPLNRLRKEAAFNRLLARMHRAAPGTWALKGGIALIARVGLAVRGTKDADANWRATRDALEDALSTIEELGLEDWFRFEVGDGRPLRGEGEDGALRFSVTARLDGCVFDQLTLDVNVVGQHDPRPVESVRLERNPFEFVVEPALEVPMVTPSQQLAEKLHAYTRRYNDEISSRVKDLFDMLVIAGQVELPEGATLADAIRETFRIRATDWPPRVQPPPASWARPWTGLVADYPLPWTNLHDAFVALQQFWTRS